MAKQFQPNITPEILRLVGRLDEFKGAWPAIERTLVPERSDALRQAAFIENVGAGARLDGLRIADKDVVRLLATRPAWSFKTSGERKVAGYAVALEASVRASVQESFTEEFIRQRHRELFQHTEGDPRRHGAYKRVPNKLEGLDADGFTTASPDEAPKRMREIVGWINRSLGDSQNHPLVMIPVFTAVFTAISPFDEGNGRLGRLLTLVLLQRAGYGFMPYSSLDKVLESDQKGYVRAMRAALDTLTGQMPDCTSWTLFLLKSLEAQAQRLYGATETEKKGKGERGRDAVEENLPELSARIVACIRSAGRADMGALISETGVSRNTLKEHLRKLLAAGRIVKHGERRGTWYTLPK